MKNFTHYVALLDAFSQAIQFRTSKARSTLGSVIGAVFTIAILVLTLPYLVERFTVLVEHQDQQISIEVTSNQFQSEPIELVVGEAPNE
jgi:Ca2+/Na+ antiporter